MEPFMLAACVAGMLTGSCNTFQLVDFDSKAECEQVEQQNVRQYGRKAFMFTGCMPKIDQYKPAPTASLTKMNLCTRGAVGCGHADRLVFPTAESCEETRKHISRNYGTEYGGVRRFKTLECVPYNEGGLTVDLLKAKKNERTQGSKVSAVEEETFWEKVTREYPHKIYAASSFHRGY